MAFTLIRGSFVPKAGVPDGDSVRFRANNPKLWKKLEGAPVEIGTSVKTKGTVQLRLEGIDAIEKGAVKPQATDARDNLFKLIGFDPANNPEPKGYLLARMTDDKTRRPICFIFTGKPPASDGGQVFLDPALLRRSVNFKQMEEGFAYPLYYNTLFASLRQTFNQALAAGKKKPKGSLKQDASRKGVSVSKKADLDKIKPIWPKLWRRLEEFLRTHNSLSGFVAFLAKKNERLDVLSVMEERGLQDVVEVKGHTVRLTENPENLRVVGKAGKRNR